MMMMMMMMMMMIRGKVVPVLSLSSMPWKRIVGVEVYRHLFFDLYTRWR
jgi:hypothetical protein